jgi:4-amino-4-deoxy-L-arabinose transferase-like glycosyltransferase
MSQGIKKLKHVVLFITGVILLFHVGKQIYSEFLSDREEMPCLHGDILRIDETDYHMEAVNLLHGKFPVIGYTQPDSVYKLCIPKGREFYFDMLKHIGPVTMLARAPVYIISLAIAYKFLGISIYTITFLNIFFILAAACFLYLIAYNYLKDYAFFAMSLGVWVWWHYFPVPLDVSDAETLLLFAFSFLVYFLDNAFTKESKGRYLLAGIATAFAMLSKGVFIMVPLLVLFVLLIQHRRQLKAALSFASAYVIGVFILLLPWIIFINYKRVASVTERQQSRERLKEITPNLHFNNNRDYIIANAAVDSTLSVIPQWMLTYGYNFYLTDGGFIVLTNQVTDEVCLMLNNEYCTDGGLHPEWKIISNSYYNTHPVHASATMRCLLFYYHQPRYFVKIMSAKLAVCRQFPHWFFLAGWVWGMQIWDEWLKKKGWQGKRNLVLLFAALLGIFVLFTAREAMLFIFPLWLLAALVRGAFNPLRAHLLTVGILWLSVIFVILPFQGQIRYIGFYTAFSVVYLVYSFLNSIKKA